MGHMYPTNVCQSLIKLIYAKGNVSINDVIAKMKKDKKYVSCAEGEYGATEDTEYMYNMALESILNIYLKPERFYEDKKLVISSIVEPIFKDEHQRILFIDWEQHGYEAFENDEDNYNDFCNIKFKFGKGWRKKYLENKITIISHIES